MDNYTATIHYAEDFKGPKLSAADYIFGSSYQGAEQRRAYERRYNRALNRWWKQLFGVNLPNWNGLVNK